MITKLKSRFNEKMNWYNPWSAMVETRNWLEMPDEIMGGMILQRLGAAEIFFTTQKVCTTWRRICKDPAMWKIIRLDDRFRNVSYKKEDFKKLCKKAVHRSCGELIDISIDVYGTDYLLNYISRFSSKLNRLSLTNGHGITGFGLNNALKRLPHLETLELSFISICAKDIEVVGRNCPQLKSFKMLSWSIDFVGFAHAIAISMPALRHLELAGATTVQDDGVRAILNGCLHLESLDLSRCSNIYLDSNLEKLCRERIKDFKCECEDQLSLWRVRIIELSEEVERGFKIIYWFCIVVIVLSSLCAV